MANKPNGGRKLEPPVIEATRAVVRMLCSDGEDDAIVQFRTDLLNWLSNLKSAQALREPLGRAGLGVSDIVQPECLKAGENPGPSESTISRFIDGKGKTRNLFVNTMFVYVVTEQSDAFWKALEGRAVDEHYTFIREVRRVFGHEASVTLRDAELYEGTYELYHPFHFGPREAAVVASLTIGGLEAVPGSDLGPFDALLEYRYERGAKLYKDTFRGKLVKHGLTASVYLSSPTLSHFIIYIDQRWGGTPYDSFGGIMIAGVSGKDPASAWPVYAERVSDGAKVDMRVVKADDVPPEARDQLQRGSVHWRHDDYPGFPEPPAPGRRQPHPKS